MSEENRTNRLWKRQFNVDMVVLVRLVETLSRQERVRKTHLHYASRTSWASLDRYLDWLQDNNMIKCIIHDSKKEYQLTELGRQMCALVMKLEEHLKSAKTIFTIPISILSYSIGNIMDTVC